MARPGEQFQNFVAMLERTLNPIDGVEVHSPYHLRDRDTGELREHDVVIIRTTHHDRHLTAVECRDRSRKVTVNEVEGFANKCQHTGVHHGVIVAAKGFTKSARAKAAAQNISCVELAAAERFSWMGQNILTVRSFNFLEIRCDLVLDDPAKASKPPYQLIDAAGATLPDDTLMALIDEAMPDDEREAPANTPRHGSLDAEVRGYRVRDGEGQFYEVQRIRLRYTLQIAETSAPFSLHTYTSGSSNLDIAHGDGGTGQEAASITMIGSESGVTGFVRHPTAIKPWIKVGDLPAKKLD
ncbi:hypothetical protein U91I_03435 [alpha proteobacterium U9-1i]|nr:hypothetical protein U91I_03435 [alpha proteobacterium U9-1i]